MDKKTIWLINQYASTSETGMGERHYYLARGLAKQGYKAYLIAASYAHLLRHLQSVELAYKAQSVEGFNFAWMRLLGYPEARSKKRVLNWFAFSWKLCEIKSVIPDPLGTIFYSSSSLIGYLASHYCSHWEGWSSLFGRFERLTRFRPMALSWILSI